MNLCEFEACLVLVHSMNSRIVGLHRETCLEKQQKNLVLLNIGVSAYRYVHRCLWRPGGGSPGAELRGSCEHSTWMLRTELGSPTGVV